MVNLQPRDGIFAAAVEGAGVWLAFSAYRRPLPGQGDVAGQGDVDVGLPLFVHQLGEVLQTLLVVRVVDGLSLVVGRGGIARVIVQRDVVELTRHGGDGRGESALLGAVRPQLGYRVVGHHVRLPAGDGDVVLGVFALLHLYPALLRALSGIAFFVGTLCIGIELEALHLVECIVRRRDAHLGQLVGKGQRDGCLVVSRARGVQQVGKTLALVAEVDGATLCGVPGGDGMFAGVAPVQGCFGFGGVVVLHGVDADLVLAVYLYGEQVARVEHATRAVRNLADARLRCAPGLCLAALHSEGDAGYLKGVLSFGQTVAVRQFVLRAGSHGKEQGGCGKKQMDGMSFLHIGLSFYLFPFSAAACEGGRRTILSMGSSGLTLAPGQRCAGITTLHLHRSNLRIPTG